MHNSNFAALPEALGEVGGEGEAHGDQLHGGLPHIFIGCSSRSPGSHREKWRNLPHGPGRKQESHS